MSTSIFDFVHLFPICMDILDKQKGNVDRGGVWEQICSGSSEPELKEYLKDENLKKANICTLANLYLVDIDNMVEDILTEAACKYFFYWLSYNLEHLDKIQDIKDNYDAFLKIIEGGVPGITRHKCRNYEDSITVHDFAILKAVHGMHSYVTNVDNRNIHYNDLKFHKSINDFKNKYNIITETKDMGVNISEIATPCKTNIGVPIVITFSTMLLLCILSFIFYKYTNIFSLFQRKILKKKNYLNNMDNEENIFQPETSRMILNDISYNVSYKFD
ncbi:variable surface protein [Plasmodium gonderi]|uniref:Variable surface protein n=1 Tax=Plasmodium gonderi TaxID=77519 RepID=A0A1Y1JRS9_PLAGO|nr:variable surface protein [Plasmodium gonderi]GAW84185.1 variable surface protein [Plasmodium gonderi]